MYVCSTDTGDSVVEWLSYKVLFVVASVVFVQKLSLGCSIDCWILSYTLLDVSDVYIFVNDVERNFGGNVGR